MQTDLYVLTASRPKVAVGELLAHLAGMRLTAAMVEEWPAPTAYGREQLAFGGEVLMAWPDEGVLAERFDALAAQGAWRRLVHANYDMRMDGVCFAHQGPARELFGPSVTGHYLSIQPHGGSRLLHTAIADWLAARHGGRVVDPYEPQAMDGAPRWQRLVAGSIANPDRLRA